MIKEAHYPSVQEYIEYVTPSSYYNSFELEPLPPTPVQPVAVPKRKKEMCNYNHNLTNAVAIATQVDTESSKREYLSDRSYSIRQKLMYALRKQFYMDQLYPTTRQELADMLKNGLYEISCITNDPTEKIYGPTANRLISFRDPAHPKDEKGYDTAIDALDKAHQLIKDSVQINQLDKALADVQAFESWTYTPTAA